MLATIASTAVGALLERNGIPVLSYAICLPALVWQGELWRLFTWVLVQTSGGGLPLIFGCVAVYFFVPDLLLRWGSSRFFVIYFGVPALAAAVTCLVARFLWHGLALVPYSGMWTAIDALVIAWAALNPDRQILLYFVLPVTGRQMLFLMVGGTLLTAVIDGPALYMPHLMAELFMLMYMDVISVRRLFLRGRMAMLQRDYRRRTAHLHVVERDDEKPPRWMH
jgi:membrane associated rhomboid family serine protease